MCTPIGPSLRLAVACALTAAALSSDTTAQSSIRGWARIAYDTEARNGTFTQVAAGYDETLVLRSDGLVFGQGEGSYGGCAAPLPPPGLVFTDIATGGSAGIGLLSDGTVVGWGDFYAGMHYWPPPANPPGVVFTDVAGAGNSCLALRSDGLVVGWGFNFFGECNVPSFSGLAATKVEAGSRHSVALLADGTVRVWGDNSYGQCNVPPFPPGRTCVDIAAGGGQTLALLSDGTVVGWGNNSDGQLQIPALPPGTTYSGIGCGLLQSYLLRSDGVLLAIGFNHYGQCNVPTLPPGVSFLQVVGGYAHTVALLSNGKVLTWGGSHFTQGYIPELPATERWVDARQGGYFAFGLTTAGHIEAWGDDRYNQCHVPPLPAGRRYVKMSAGLLHGLAIRDDGSMVGWGDNGQGQISIPQLPAGITYSQVVTGVTFTGAILSDGTAIVFGNHVHTIPSLPPGMRYVDIDVAGANVMLMRSDRTVFCLSGAFVNRDPFPVLPAGVEYSGFAACEDGWNLLKTTDGQLAFLGRTYATGTSGWYPIPPLPSGVVYVEATGGHHIMAARRSDGQVVVFGYVIGPTLNVPPLLPGTSYVQVDAFWDVLSARVGPTSTYTSFAAGCAGSRQPARLVPQDTPRIDKVHEVYVFDLPENAAFMLFGWNRTAPLSLTPYGMPGCSAAVSPDGAYFLAGQNGVAKYRLSIPNYPALVGLRFHNQAIVLDQAAGNPLGAVISDAAEGVIGHW